jgi:hypothetical protein
MTERTHFPTWAILSALTGRLCGDVHVYQLCLERLAGGPVMTHQLGRWPREHHDMIAAAFPDLVDYDVSGLDPTTARDWLAERREFLDRERFVPVLGDAPSDPLSDERANASYYAKRLRHMLARFRHFG